MKQSARARYGILSYCEDLTDPESHSHPVAAVGLLTVTGPLEYRLAFIVSEPVGDEQALVGDDPVAKEMLARLPDVLKRAVDEALEEVGAEGLFEALSERVRGSFHLTQTGEQDIPLRQGGGETAVFDATTKLFWRMLEPPRVVPQPVRFLPPSVTYFYPRQIAAAG